MGWFNGRPSNNTRRLLVEHGGFLYDRDYPTSFPSGLKLASGATL